MEKENNANICQNITTYCTEYRPYSILYKVDNDGVISWKEDGSVNTLGGVIKVIFDYTATTVNEECNVINDIGTYEDVINIPPILCDGEKEGEIITYGRPKDNYTGLDIWCFYEDTKIIGKTSFVLPCDGGTVSTQFEYENNKICGNALTVHTDEFPSFVKEVNIDTANTVITVTTIQNTTEKEIGGTICIYNNEKYLESISIILMANEKCQKSTKFSTRKDNEINATNTIPTPDDKEYMKFDGEIVFKTPSENCSNVVRYEIYQKAKYCEENNTEIEDKKEKDLK